MARTEEDAKADIQHVLASEYTCYRKHTLALSNCALYRLPQQLWKISFIHQLDLSDNKLARLPAEISSMVSLRILKLRNNELATLPSSIGALKSLHMLDVSHNALKQVPTTISKLLHLQYLHLDNNHLTALPKEILRLPLPNMFVVNVCDNDFPLLPVTTTTYFVPSLLSIAMTKVVAYGGQAAIHSPLLPSDLREAFSRDLNECELCGQKYYGCAMGEKLEAGTIQGQPVALSTRRCSPGCTGTW